MGQEFLKLFQEYLFAPSVMMTVGAIEPEWFEAFFQCVSNTEVYGFSGSLNLYHLTFQGLLPWIQSKKLHWELVPLELRPLKNNLSHASFLPDKTGIVSPALGFLDDYCHKAHIPWIHYLKIQGTTGNEWALGCAPLIIETGKVDFIEVNFSGFESASGNVLGASLKKGGYRLFRVNPDVSFYRWESLSWDRISGKTHLLAVHPRYNFRFQKIILGNQATPPSFSQLCNLYGVHPRGVIQVGAYDGVEIHEFSKMGATSILSVEANPTAYNQLQQTLSEVPKRPDLAIDTAMVAISDEDGWATLRVTSFQMSSSILPLKHHADIYPEIQETHQVVVPSRRLDTLLEELGLNPSDYNILMIDIQGAELKALQGGEQWLQGVDGIYTEVNFIELYEGCVLIHQLDDYLFQRGFERVYLDNHYHPTWGDAFYLRRGRLAISCLGKIGRFANQLFQYAFVKCYAKDHYLTVEAPPWDGQFLFGHSDPPVTPGLPLFKENVWTFTEEHSKILSHTNPLSGPLRNVDVWGYFQYPTKYYLPHQDSIRQLFNPVPAIEAQMQQGLEGLSLQNKTLVGLHLRRGDYQDGNSFPCFYAAPSQWYLDWLEGFWETLDNPLLYLASDDLEAVLPDFEKYQPITAESLGLSLPEAPYYPDFYVLTLCQVLAISNSSFSVMASMLNETASIFVRPDADLEALIPFDPWNCQVLWTPPSYQGNAYQE